MVNCKILSIFLLKGKWGKFRLPNNLIFKGITIDNWLQDKILFPQKQVFINTFLAPWRSKISKTVS